VLADVYRAVAADFKASGCNAAVLFGLEFLSENSEPNRVVFAPTDDGAYMAPLGTQGAGMPPANMADGTNPFPIMRRPAGGEIHIWGAAARQEDGTQQLARDYDVLNALINQTALSLYRTCGLGGVLKITGGKNTPGPAHVRRGFVYVMRIQVEIPIVDIDFPCGPIDGSQKTWDTQDDVSANITVEMRESLPTGPLISSTNLIVSGS
jgi:hypothetical protein